MVSNVGCMSRFKRTIRDATAGYTRDVKWTSRDAMVIHEMLNERVEMQWLYMRC